jgi:hypothetical protein
MHKSASGKGKPFGAKKKGDILILVMPAKAGIQSLSD